MKPVIYPVEREKLLDELTPDKFVRKTNKAGNEIYIFAQSYAGGGPYKGTHFQNGRRGNR